MPRSIYGILIHVVGIQAPVVGYYAFEINTSPTSIVTDVTMDSNPACVQILDLGKQMRKGALLR